MWLSHSREANCCQPWNRFCEAIGSSAPACFLPSRGHKAARISSTRLVFHQLQKKAQIAHTHEVQFYSDDESFLAGFGRFIEAALLAGNAVIVAATEVHQDALLRKLHESGLDLSSAIDEGRYLTLDIAATLSNFMVNGLPDPARFQKATSSVIIQAARAAKGTPPRVAVCGECAPALWVEGKVDGAIQLEHLWDEITKQYDLDVLCGYVLTDFQRDHENHVRERICAEHSAVLSK